jgi:tRNA nucleotidyltransferase (CCA-adding enzyme)
MKQTFDPLLKDPRTLLLNTILSAHGELYVVGGAIRDHILGRSIKDIDYAYSRNPEEIISILEKANIRVIPTGLSHQTVTAKPLEDLPHVEITSFRNADMKPEGGVFLGSSISEDLLYRDFTVNALALPTHHVTKDTKILIDPTDGLEDIKNKIIRTPGSPTERFREDPLRILRMVRFTGQLDFSIEENTEKEAKSLFHLLSSVSIERIRDEFFKILLTDNVRNALLKLKELNFFSMFLPEIDQCIDFEQNRFHKHDVFLHTIDVIENTPPALLLRLSALFHDIGKPPSLSVDANGERHFYLHEKIGAEMISDIAKRLKFSNELHEALKKLTHTHMRPVDAGTGGLRRILRDTEPYYQQWRTLKYADTIAVLGETETVKNTFSEFDQRIKTILDNEANAPFRKLAVGGTDLIEMGFTPGPKFKEILSYLEEIIIEDPSLNTHETLIRMIGDKYKA